MASALTEVLLDAEAVSVVWRCHGAGVSCGRDDELDELVSCGREDELDELVVGCGCISTVMVRLSEPLWFDGFRTVAPTRRRISSCCHAGSWRTSPLDDGCALSQDGATGRPNSVLLELKTGLLLFAVVVLAACAGVNWGSGALEVAAGAIPSSGGGTGSRW